jgi:hypothetical protein
MPDEYFDSLVAQEAIVFNNILRLVSPDFSEIEHELYLVISFTTTVRAISPKFRKKGHLGKGLPA